MRRARICLVLISSLGLVGACGSDGGGKAKSEPDGGAPDAFHATGCAAAPPHPPAPGGYYVNGNTICTADGRAHLFHGVDRPSLEWSSGGENLSLADFRLMASWNTNVVRVALNQDFWLAESPIFDPSYAGMVDSAVAWAEAEGMDVILDLHWSDAGVLGEDRPDRRSGRGLCRVAGRRRAGQRLVRQPRRNGPRDRHRDGMIGEKMRAA